MANNQTYCPTLRIGSEGYQVKRLQNLLAKEGFSPGPIDGIFGSRTRRSVILLQKSEDLRPNGIVDINTWTVLGIRCSSPLSKRYPYKCAAGSSPYIIRTRDNLYRISKKYNTSIEAITRINAHIDPKQLEIGQLICIPRN